MLKAVEVIEFFRKVKSKEDLDMVKHEFLLTRERLDSDRRRTLRLGDNVSFLYKGRRIHGRITRKNRKTMTVMAHEGSNEWRVPPSMLSEEA